MEKTTIDLTTEDGASRVARQIVDYWKERGSRAIMAAPVQVKATNKTHTHAMWGVVSNLGGLGFPPDCKKE